MILWKLTDRCYTKPLAGHIFTGETVVISDNTSYYINLHGIIFLI